MASVGETLYIKMKYIYVACPPTRWWPHPRRDFLKSIKLSAWFTVPERRQRTDAGFIRSPPSTWHLLETLFNCRPPCKFGVGSRASWKCSNYEMTFTGNGAGLASLEPKPQRTEVISPPEGKQRRQHPVDFIDFEWHGPALPFKAVIITALKLPCRGPRVGGAVQSSTEPKTTFYLPNWCTRFTLLHY